MFWVIAAAGMAGYSLSLGASLWANPDRKRRELSVLRLRGFRGGGIMLYPSFHALFTAVLGWLGAVFVYLLREIGRQQAIDDLFGGRAVHLFSHASTLTRGLVVDLDREPPRRRPRRAYRALGRVAGGLMVARDNAAAVHADALHPSAPVRLSFAQSLQRVFDIDIAECPRVAAVP